MLQLFPLEVFCQAELLVVLGLRTRPLALDSEPVQLVYGKREGERGEGSHEGPADLEE